ncbi:MAG: hypothetical protein K2L96_01570 [Muribaculaceae bacterium]|nr:hypothetical protein [Muribaculaceae bacterium]
MDLHALTELLLRAERNPDFRPDAGELALLEEASHLYPYFAGPQTALALASDPDTEEGRELRLRAAMRGLGHPEFEAATSGGEWLGFYPAPESEPTPDTESAIDTFLSTYGQTSPEEEELLNRLIFNPVPDYGEILAREEQDNLPEAPEAGDEDSPEGRIAAFILERHPASKSTGATAESGPATSTPEQPASAPEPHDDSLLSESLAKIYIKQGRYERAYEIISGLNLKFPKKSVYFADQLRFLQKLIINERAKTQNNTNSAADE